MTSTNSAIESGTTMPGRQLLVDLGDGAGPLRARLEAALRTALRDGRLAAGDALPSSRTLAADLGVSRRLVVEAYAQLTAEGWLQARQGAGTRVAPGAPSGAAARPPAPAPRERPAYDFFPGAPDVGAFPRDAWLRAARDVLRTAPDRALQYPDAAGVPELRAALAAHLARVRGVAADPAAVVVVHGARQALALLGRALVRSGHAAVAVEWPSLPVHAETLAAAGLQVRRVPVDEDGLDVEALARTDARAVVVTPAHQFPLGMALAPARRAALLEWAAEGPERLVIEDDYDAEFRYDGRPVGTLQGMAPEHVAYVGSASKVLAPALRLGWLALPSGLVGPLTREKLLQDAGCAVIDQLVLARLLETAAYDRHVRGARRRYRARRDALASALAAEVPGVRLRGMAAGLHAVADLPRAVGTDALVAGARAREVGVYPIPGPGGSTTALILGYAALSEPAIREGVRRLAQALAEA